MESSHKGVVVQIVLPVLDTQDEIDAVLKTSFEDIRTTLHEVLEMRQQGKEVPSGLVRDFRVGGEDEQHYA